MRRAMAASSDKVDRHYLRTFGSAILLAIIGTGIDMAVPESSTLATQDTASDAARRNFAETFGRVAEHDDFSKNLNVQPTSSSNFGVDPAGLQVQRAR
jgi:type IV secretory pathway VirB10-like protein